MIALIIANGDEVDISSIKNINYEYVICADGGLKKADHMGILPNAILGDFDSVDPDILKKYMLMNIETKKFPPEKDFTDMELSIEFAVEKGYKKLVLISALGSRFDHSVANIMLIEKYLKLGIRIEIIDNNNKIQIISDNTEICIESKKNSFVSIVPLTDTISGLTLEGFKYPLDKKTVNRGSAQCVSNEIVSNYGRVSLEKGTALLFVSND
ncbi:MAG: thiamine diphosphokinase [Sedimentibacter sp.]